MIINNVIQLFKHINIIPLYPIHYTFSNFSTYEQIKYGFEESCELLTDINNEIKIDVPSDNRIFYFAIPSIYRITKVYAIDSQNYKYNWTGSVFIGNTSNTVIYKNNSSSCVFPYTLYKLQAQSLNIGETSQNTCKQIILCVSLINKVITYDQNYIKKYTNNNLPNISLSRFNITLNDEDFNNLYWVSFNDNNQTLIKISNTLAPLKNNGTTHTWN